MEQYNSVQSDADKRTSDKQDTVKRAARHDEKGV